MACELLRGLRLLDLCDEQGALCGKLLADLGAEVIKIERPEGCPTRSIPPFLDGQPGPLQSLYSLAYHAGKKSLTLELDVPAGRGQLLTLAAQSDFLVESFAPGYLDSLGLGYSELSARNPGLIYASITPFGDTGPARNYRASDLVTWAAGGMMYLMGREGKPPLQMSLPQAGLHAGAEAAVALLLALHARARGGLGQHIVVNMQACIVWTLMNEQAMPILHGACLSRSGVYAGGLGPRRKMVYRCADGHISALLAGGPVGGASMRALIGWMDDKSGEFAAEWMRTKDWTGWIPGLLMKLSDDERREIDDLEARVELFFMTMTRREIYAEALTRRILLAPVASVADIAVDEQLKAREFFVDVEHPGLGRTLRMPGAFARFSATPLGAPSPAPNIGEHNRSVTCETAHLGRASQPAAKPPRYALEGIHVLDFSWVAVGPTTTKYLADNGAEVIRVESAARLDVLRMGPPWKDGQPGLNRSQFFASFNTSKKDLTLDLGHPRAREIVLRLLPWADVVTESFTPKAMRQWGLDYQHLRAVKPDIIMMSTCMQGQSGPHALYAGFGQLMAALAGFYFISGYSADEPCPPYGAYTDFVVPRFAAAAILAALDYRRHTGIGQYIDIAQYEASLHFLAPALVDFFASGRVLRACGNRSARFAPHGAYRCADEAGSERWLALTVADDAEWKAMATVLEYAGDGFATMAQRIAEAAALDELVGTLVRRREVWELTRSLQAAGIAAYPVQNCLDLHDDDNLRAFDFWQWLEHKEVGAMPYEGLQHRMSRTPGRLRRAAPILGQDNHAILSDLLGLTGAEIEQLKRDKVVF